MYLVLEAELFGGYALGAFGVAQDTDSVEGYTQDLRKSRLDINGGATESDSPWFIPGSDMKIGEFDDQDSESTKPKNSSGSDDDDGDGDSEGVSTGLSKGAKAGIGVGVSLGTLLLIGLAVFFFLRHRRRRRAAASAATLTPANDYIRDKETHAAQVAESPHSPASDDDRPRDSALVGDPSSPVAPTPTSGTREVPHSVAHLVEEGMTEDQIRRLEEEERALDQAIEQAGRR